MRLSSSLPTLSSAVLAFTLGASAAGAQGSTSTALELTVDGYGVAIGDVPRINGLRINFRDQQLEEVNGVNVTLWTPVGSPSGVVNGAAIGLPATGAEEIHGLSIAIFGVGAGDDLTGVGIAPIGLGAGDRVSGIMLAGIGVGGGGSMKGVGVGGIGVGAGGDLSGLMIGGIGVGGGGSVTGIQIGGIGVGGGGDIRGLSIGGIGVGGGGNVSGISIAGVGVGGGGDITGLSVALIGVGAGGRVTGITIGGIGVGAGTRLKGLSIGAAVGSPRVEGIAIGGVVGGEDVTAGVVAPGYFRIADNGRFKGVVASAFNHIEGEQVGLSIGVLNYTRRLRGVQLGVLNIVRENPVPFRVLPLINVRMD